jgi:cob(I)alamin adenosyltransferase
MKIYTKTGDDGETGLFGGPRVSKDHVRIAAYGDVDELNALLGWVRTIELPPGCDVLIGSIQHDLFAIGAELATPRPAQHGTTFHGQSRIEALEQTIDEAESSLAPLKQFILPGGAPAAAALHVARTVCRRAERSVVTLAASAGTTISPEVLIYLNRLSDLLFVLARSANSHAGVADVPWQPAKCEEKT